MSVELNNPTYRVIQSFISSLLAICLLVIWLYMGLSIMKDGAKGKGKKLRDPFVALKKYEPQQNTLI